MTTKKRTLQDIKDLLKRNRPDLETRFKVKTIGIFGSFVRGEQGASSDIDILVEFSEPVGWEFLDLKEHLEGLLGMNVDLVTVRALKPRMSKAILNEVVYA